MLPPVKEFAGNRRNKRLRLIRKITEKHRQLAPQPKEACGAQLIESLTSRGLGKGRFKAQ
jgi:hypothetical protein